MKPLVPEPQFQGEKLRVQYFTGRASWHQRRAGHSSAGSITCDHTFAEHVTFLENYAKKGEPVTLGTVEPA